MPFRTTTSVIALIGALVATPATAQEVEEITLSTSGTALINATTRILDGQSEISVRRADLDAVLKTLQIRDTEQSRFRIDLAGPSRAAAAFDGSPFSPENLSTPEAILRAMRGRKVAISSDGVTHQGHVTGVETRECDAGNCAFVTLMTEDRRVARVRISEDVRVALLGDGDRDALTRAIDALDDMTISDRITMNLESSVSRDRDVGLTLIQDAQPWRTAWRAISDGETVRLTGRSIIENRSGWAWEDVKLTLATGEVQTLSPELYNPSVTADRGSPGASSMSLANARSTSADMMELQAVTAAAPKMQQSQSFSRYTLPDPVSLEPGEMAVLPFLTEDLPNARGLRHRGGRGATHPEVVLTIENPLPLRLPGGVLTLYEDARGHAGDAEVPEIPANGETTVRFAQDTAVEVREERSSENLVRNMRISDGVLRITETMRREVTYRFIGAADGDRTVTLEHPIRSGWRTRTPGGERQADYTAWDVEVPEEGETLFKVTEEQPRTNLVRIGDLDGEDLTRWSRTAPDASVRKTLERIATTRSEIADKERLIKNLDDQRDGLIDDQDRVLKLLRSLGNASSNRQARVERVEDIEARIGTLRDRIRSARKEQEELRDRMRRLMDAA